MKPQRTSLWQRLLNTWQHNRRKSRYVIDMTTNGFVFRTKQRRTEMHWEQVTRIDAGITNCLNFDVLYVRIFTRQATVYMDIPALARHPGALGRAPQMCAARSAA